MTDKKRKGEKMLHLSAQLTGEINAGLFKYKLNDRGMNADTAYRIVKDQLMVEGNARLNLATFCQTYMEPQAVKIISETLEKNAIDKSLYTQTAEIEDRCVEIIANLWNRPDKPDEPEEYPEEDLKEDSDNLEEIPKPKGTSTIGSSEACMLGGLAMLERWRGWAKKQDNFRIDPLKKPNLIISSGYQVCWEKFEKYWNVELRQIPLERDTLCMDMNKLADGIDEYTIGVVAVLGLTYTGMYDDVEAIDKKLKEYNAKGHNQVNIHVDAASGGFYEPFIDPDYEWDFRVENVVSINASGHKYGLVFPGVGWVVWRNGKYLPQKLTFEVSYLGGSVRTVGINFSKSAGHIIAQYYNFVRLGMQGYKKIHTVTREASRLITEKVQGITAVVNGEKVKVFEVLGETGLKEHAHRLPLVCWKLSDEIIKAGINWGLTDLSDRMLMRGWQIPSYPLPRDLKRVMIQRVVCRAVLSLDLAEILANDMQVAVDFLTKNKKPTVKKAVKTTKRYTIDSFDLPKTDLTNNTTEEPEELKPYGFTH